jgi:hypothetical protein
VDYWGERKSRKESGEWGVASAERRNRGFAAADTESIEEDGFLPAFEMTLIHRDSSVKLRRRPAGKSIYGAEMGVDYGARTVIVGAGNRLRFGL